MKILLLGGSKFMGLELVKRLIDMDIELYIINRGNTYWNGKFSEIIEGKNCKHFKFDRNDDNFSKNIKSLGVYFDYVIDFTCYDTNDVNGLFDGLNYQFKNYIFISTDSVYNVCEIGVKRTDEYYFNNNDIPLVVEYDAICSDREKGKKRDSYGYNKYKSERRIIELLSGKDISYYFLRLPDVIGEYDETYRIWYYIEWLRNTNIMPIEVEQIDEVRKLSFVYSCDVCNVIIGLIIDNKPYGIYNIAHSESITLVELIEYVAKKIGVQFTYKVKDFTTTYYPSVNIGPISNEKAISLLNFRPTPLFEAIDKSLQFFEKAYDLYPKEYQEMKKDLPKKLKNYLNNLLNI